MTNCFEVDGIRYSRVEDERSFYRVNLFSFKNDYEVDTYGNIMWDPALVIFRHPDPAFLQELEHQNQDLFAKMRKHDKQ